MPVNWKRSEEGYSKSKCGRYKIRPLYFGCINPQSYELVFVATGEVIRRCETQRAAKVEADTHWRKKRSEIGILWD